MAPFRCAVGLLVLAVGCDGSRPEPVGVPTYESAQGAQAMLAEYDANKNGTIEGAELDACPSLRAALARFDTNKDKKVGLDELTARFNGYSQAGVGTVGVGVRLLFNGSPLADAAVTFTPEKCFGTSLQGGKAVTRTDGVAAPKRDDGAPGLSPGLYRVTVSAPNIPAEYATQNLLGVEVGSGGRDGGSTAELKLSSKPK